MRATPCAIQLLESPIPTPTPTPTATTTTTPTTSQKASSGDISGTKRGSIDPQNGPKWFQMVQNGPKWSKLSKWSKMVNIAKNGKKL